MRNAEVAQQVEQRTENPRVIGPIPILGTFPGGSSSVVECLLAKEEVASSNLVFRSNFIIRAEVAEQADAMVSKTIGGQPSCRFDPDLRQYKHIAELCSGSTADFESVCQGSNPCSAATSYQAFYYPNQPEITRLQYFYSFIFPRKLSLFRQCRISSFSGTPWSHAPPSPCQGLASSRQE